MAVCARYGIGGALFGACFPVVGTLVQAQVDSHDLSLASLGRVQASSPLLWIIDTAPFWLGLFALAIGRREERLRQVIRDREATIAIRTDELQFAAARAEAANRAKSRFLGNMSHEIRTPMTAILGYAEMLQDAGIAADRRDEAARIIRGNGEHLLQIINDILDLSKVEADKMTIEHVDCSPHAIVAEVIALLAVQAAHKGLDLRAEFDGPLPERMRGDPLRIRQILLNLAGNGLKFTERGQVLLKVRMVGEAPTARIEIAVHDTGIGMTTEQIGRLFHAFNQADDTTSRRYGGTGLGLALCKRLVQLMDGECVVASTPGQGSIFTVSLPAGDLTGVRMTDEPGESKGTGLVRTNEPATAEMPRLTGLRVLLAEDNRFNAQVIQHVLAREGAEVAVAANGRLAVEMALAAPVAGEGFAVVLMDIQMPEMDGHEAARALRAAGFRKPIIALTAGVMPGERQSAIEAGCDDYATKPIDRRDLTAKILRLACASAPTEAVVVTTR